MAIQFYNLKVKEVRRETDQAVSLFFDIPDNLKDDFKYKPGQYITIKLDLEGEPRRAYSLSTSPHTDSEFGVTIKEVQGGKVSTYINNELKAGDMLDVMPPLGNFTTIIDEHNIRKFVMFAGGSGITPIISLIKSILKVEVNSRLTLFYANQTNDSVIFKKELDELENNHSDKFKIIHILEDNPLSWECETGRFTAERISELFRNYNINIQDSEYFMCGPAPMMEAIEDGLKIVGAKNSSINKELFTAAENQSERLEKDTSGNNASKGSSSKKLKVTIYGEDYEIDCNDDETILMAGIRNHLDPPFSCQIGACSTCMAQVKKGEVEMEVDDALTPDEIEDGFILTCTSHVKSDEVEIDYDY